MVGTQLKVLLLSTLALWVGYHMSLALSNMHIFDVDSGISPSIIVTTLPSSDNKDLEVSVNGTSRCTFLPEEFGNPLPVILVSPGRSGSTVTWNTLSRFVGEENIAYEYTGSNKNATSMFIERIKPQVGDKWASLHLCKLQNKERNRNSGISGFQWKPYSDLFRHKYGTGALQEMSTRKTPPIRIIHLTRNHIDVMISDLKHRAHTNITDIKAHCSVGDEECVKKHMLVSRAGIEVPVGDLVKLIRADKYNPFVEEALKETGINYINVKYEKLFNDGQDATEWMRLFQFLGRGPKQEITMDDVRSKFAFMPTTYARNKTVTNWLEVKDTLLDQGFEDILESIGELV